jgi:hypothetical protein
MSARLLTRKDESPALALASSARMAAARRDNGTRCARPPFMRQAGTVQTPFSASISPHFAPSTSLVRVTVRTANSKARAATDCRVWRHVRNAGTSAKAIALWWRGVLLGFRTDRTSYGSAVPDEQPSARRPGPCQRRWLRGTRQRGPGPWQVERN